MFDVGFFELILVLLVAIFVLKPEDLAALLYRMGKLSRKLQTFKSNLQKEYSPLVDELELKDVSKQAKKKAAKKEPLTHTSYESDDA